MLEEWQVLAVIVSALIMFCTHVNFGFFLNDSNSNQDGFKFFYNITSSIGTFIIFVVLLLTVIQNG